MQAVETHHFAIKRVMQEALDDAGIVAVSCDLVFREAIDHGVEQEAEHRGIHLSGLGIDGPHAKHVLEVIPHRAGEIITESGHRQLGHRGGLRHVKPPFPLASRRMAQGGHSMKEPGHARREFFGRAAQEQSRWLGGLASGIHSSVKELHRAGRARQEKIVQEKCVTGVPERFVESPRASRALSGRKAWPLVEEGSAPSVQPVTTRFSSGSHGASSHPLSSTASGGWAS